MPRGTQLGFQDKLASEWPPRRLARNRGPVAADHRHCLITEALTHTDLPQVDAIELYNPTAGAINIGGWFLTDDRLNAYKFRIPDGRLIQPGSYVTSTKTSSIRAARALPSGRTDESIFSAGTAPTSPATCMATALGPPKTASPSAAM